MAEQLLDFTMTIAQPRNAASALLNASGASKITRVGARSSRSRRSTLQARIAFIAAMADLAARG
jgi:hypothetical protein